MKSHFNKYHLCVAAAAALWGTAGIFVRTLSASGITQMQTVFGRTLISALLLGIAALIKAPSLFKIRIKDLPLFAAAGLFSILLFNFSYYTTMSLTSLSVASVLLYTAPFFVVVISVPLFKSSINLRKAVACITAFVGCCMVSGLFDSSHRISGKALFFGLLTGFGYSLYTIFGKLLLSRGYSALTVTFYIFLSAAVCCTPFTSPFAAVTAFSSAPEAFAVIFLMALLNTVIPYILYTFGLSGTDPSAAPIIATLEPVVATAVGAVVYGEKLTVYGVIGILAVLFSVALLNRKGVTVKANAKINLTLGVTGKRKDGYHLIDTVMQSVSLHDTVSVTPSEKIRIRFTDRQIPADNNMAYKAASLFFEETGIDGGADIKIKNRIPTSSGMGGGSADAAAVLMSLNTLYETKLSEKRLEEIGLRLGADVPFFIKGGAQRAEGIGEILTPLKSLEKGFFVLVKHGNKPSTAEMYSELDTVRALLPDTASAVFAVENDDLKALSGLLVNSFSAVWSNKDIFEKLKVFKPDGISLSGSGPTVFACFTGRRAAEKAYKSLKKQNFECYFAVPRKKAIVFE